MGLTKYRNKEKIRLLPSDHEINKKDSSCLLLVYLGIRELRSLNFGDGEVRIRASLLIPYDKNKDNQWIVCTR